VERKTLCQEQENLAKNKRLNMRDERRDTHAYRCSTKEYRQKKDWEWAGRMEKKVESVRFKGKGGETQEKTSQKEGKKAGGRWHIH